MFLDCLVSGCSVIFQCWNLSEKTEQFFQLLQCAECSPSRLSLTLVHFAAINMKLSVPFNTSLGGPLTKVRITAKSCHAINQTLSYPGTYSTQESVRVNWKNKISSCAFKRSLLWLRPSQSSTRKSIREFLQHSQMGVGIRLHSAPSDIVTHRKDTDLFIIFSHLSLFAIFLQD